MEEEKDIRDDDIYRKKVSERRQNAATKFYYVAMALVALQRKFRKI